MHDPTMATTNETLGRARRTTPIDQLTDAELEAGIVAAVFYSGLDAARCYGLIDGGPTVNVERCEQVIAEAHARGLKVPTLEQAVEVWIDGTEGAHHGR